MNAINKDKAATSIEDSISGYGLSFPAILALLFVVNGIAALALVMIFSRFYGVSLACIQAILILTAISLTVWTAHQILTVVIYQNAGSGKPNTVVEWGSIGKLLFQNWRVIRDGISHSGEANLSERFANSFGMACLFAGSVVCVFSEGTRYWPQYSPVTDLLGSLFALSLLICLFDGNRSRPAWD